ncbi:MAG: carbon-nitrogen hydrolase family protein [Lachnospiraceae bacterium]|nr:carbon-nitrogen hydrolase family protein [Lachnospiraceae bacterium]
MILCQLQTLVKEDPGLAQSYVGDLVRQAAADGADMVCLPEMFACPYESKNFPPRAEEKGGPTWQFLSSLAAECGIYLSAGSVPEKEVLQTESGQEKILIYNTAYVFDREGKQIAKHRKVHLFDIDVTGGQSFRESDTLTPGDHFTVFETEFGLMGLCICFDIRFVETLRLMALKGARMVLVPAAFNMTTGPAHWELNLRSQAMLNQLYIAATSDARDMTASYHAWGHSLLADPWGAVVSQLDEREGRLMTKVDLSRVEEIRRQLPILSARRTDLYELKEK